MKKHIVLTGVLQKFNTTNNHSYRYLDIWNKFLYENKIKARKEKINIILNEKE